MIQKTEAEWDEIRIKLKDYDEAKGYLCRLLRMLHPEINLLGPLAGNVSQIDNILAGKMNEIESLKKQLDRRDRSILDL